jgi:septal ring factor EnvC (AmiA/AmiB activator)
VAVSEDTSKLIFWLLGALLALLLAGVGLYARALDTRLADAEARIEAYASREAQRYESLVASHGPRWDRLTVLQTQMAGIEPRVGAVESRVSAFEPRLPLTDNRITRLESALERFDLKLDQLLKLRSGR